MASSPISSSSSITAMISSVSTNSFSTEQSHQHIDAAVSNVYAKHKPPVNSPFTFAKPRTWVELKEWHKNLLNFLNQGQAVQPPRRYSGTPYAETPNPDAEYGILFSDDEILKIEELNFAKHTSFVQNYSKQDIDLIKTIFNGNSENSKESICKGIEYGLFALGKTFDTRHVIFQPGLDASCAAMLIMDLGKTPDLKVLNEMLWGNDLDNYIKSCKLVPVKTKIPEGPGMERILEIQKLMDKAGPGILMISGYCYPFIIDRIAIDQNNETEGTVDIRDPHHGWAITVTLKALMHYFRSRKITFLQIERNIGLLTKRAR